jgi:hypothetical protein
MNIITIGRPYLYDERVIHVKLRVGGCGKSVFSFERKRAHHETKKTARESMVFINYNY